MQLFDRDREGANPDGTFKDHDSVNGILGTKITANIFNQTGEEINTVIKSGGLTPDSNTLNQLDTSIKKQINDKASALQNSINSNVQQINQKITEINNLIQKKNMIPPWFIQISAKNGSFTSYEAPDQWYSKMYGVTSTWELMYAGESITLLTEGTYSNDGRSNGIQGDAIRNIIAEIVAGGGIGTFWGSTGSCIETADSTIYSQDRTGSLKTRVKIDASRTVPVASVNRMRNRLIRLYHLLSINGTTVSNIISGGGR